MYLWSIAYICAHTNRHPIALIEERGKVRGDNLDSFQEPAASPPRLGRLLMYESRGTVEPTT